LLRPRPWLTRLPLLLPVLLGAVPTAGRADVLRFCDPGPQASAAQQDRLLRFSALLKRELEASGQQLALVARAGLDLQRFGQRYSHAGISLKHSPNTAWSVRQLYFACDEGRPRLYDQGLAGFLLGSLTPDLSFVSVLLLPDEAAAQVQAWAADDARALQLLSPTYSANAHAYSLRYQNCNQWLVELLAASWGGLAPDTPASQAAGDELTPAVPGKEALRGQAQQWLRQQDYRPSELQISWRPLMWLGTAFIPWLHNDDHPPADLEQLSYKVSMPASIEQFARQRYPAAQRIELCLRGSQVLIRRGWEPLPADCVGGEQDQRIDLDD